LSLTERAYIDGLLGVYELNRILLMRDVFVWAYERSAARYSAVRRSLGEPDAFRLRHRTLIAETVAEIVRVGMDKKTATAFVQQRARDDVSPDEQARFVEVVGGDRDHESSRGQYCALPVAAIAIPNMEGNVALIGPVT